ASSGISSAPDWAGATAGTSNRASVPRTAWWCRRMRQTPVEGRAVGRLFSVPSLGPHPLDQDAGRLRAHHPGVGQLAGAQLLAQLPAADVHLLVPLRGALVNQADPAQLLVEGREADLHRLDQQLALQLVELALRRQAVPDVLAVVVRSVGVLAA